MDRDEDHGRLSATRSAWIPENDDPAGEWPESLPLREAAELLGVRSAQLGQLIRDGRFPEAKEAETPTGKEWVVPFDALPVLAQREGLVMDLTAADPPPSDADVLDLALLDRLLGVQEQAVLAVADAEKAEAELLELTDRYLEMQSELMVERSERAALRERFHEEQLARTRAEARARELEHRLRREEELAREERAVASDATAQRLRREREAAVASASMGRRARRRYERRVDSETVS